MKYVKKVWSWLGTEQNHNAFMVVITAVALVFALPYFSRQINKVEVKIDSLQENIKSLYGHYVRESFCSELKDSFRKNADGQNIVEIKLKYPPIENSVTVWEGNVNVSPIYFKVNDKILILETNWNADLIKEECSPNYFGVYVVTYIPAQN